MTADAIFGRSVLTTAECSLPQLEALLAVAARFEALDRAGRGTALLPDQLAYALFFAMGAGTIRTTVWILSAIMALVIGGTLLSTLLGQDVNLVQALIGWLLRAGGPFAVFTGNWALIDV